MRHFGVRARRATLVAAIVSYAALGVASPVGAWGAQGHQYVGNLGARLLNPRAAAEVRSLLGPNIDLGEAAVWADCIRSVDGSPSTSFHYRRQQGTPSACAAFDDDGIEEGRMTDYAARNWTNCEYSHRRTKCNLAYHFADVNVHNRTDYNLSYFGAGTQDVVQAIKAAITVLRCPAATTCPTPAPFNIKDKREAIFLLAHFIGDVHQPLHVGAIYLDQNDREGDDGGRSTTGGNDLLLTPGNPRDNLHHDWDTILGSLGISPSGAAVADACRIAPRPNPVLERPETWASQSVVAARPAYNGMSFRPDSTETHSWDVSFADMDDYRNGRKLSQARQLVTAGARLAATLNAIWPSTRRAAACARV